MSQDNDKSFYLIAYKEWEEQNIDEALFAKCMILNKGDDEKAKDCYLKTRVEELINESEKNEAEMARIKAEEDAEIARIKAEEDDYKFAKLKAKRKEAKESRIKDEENEKTIAAAVKKTKLPRF
jgi:hypothetical protein